MSNLTKLKATFDTLRGSYFGLLSNNESKSAKTKHY